MFAFIVLLVVAGASFYFYQRLTALEQEIRAEQARARAAVATAPVEPQKSSVKETSSSVAPVVEKVEPAPAPVQKTVVAETIDDAKLEDAILVAVAKNSGIKQTDFYKLFAKTNRKQLQTLLKDMADAGKLKRKKQGSTYLLYPV